MFLKKVVPWFLCILYHDNHLVMAFRSNVNHMLHGFLGILDLDRFFFIREGFKKNFNKFYGIFQIGHPPPPPPLILESY